MQEPDRGAIPIHGSCQLHESNSRRLCLTTLCQGASLGHFGNLHGQGRIIFLGNVFLGRELAVDANEDEELTITDLDVWLLLLPLGPEWLQNLYTT